MIGQRIFLASVAAAAFLACPPAAHGQSFADDAGAGLPETHEARVIEVIEERSVVRENGTEAVQQDLRLEITDGPERGREVEHRGISDLDVVGAQRYGKGDRVMVQGSVGPDGTEDFVVIDSVRRSPLYLLAILFAVAAAAVGGKRGVRALLALAASFAVIVKVMLPAILAGFDPLAVGLIGSLTVMAAIIYLTGGWKRKSHIAVFGVFASLTVTLLLSCLFSSLTRLSGMMQEETMFLIDAARSVADFRGLLLAGIMIGTVGVLDDIVIGQIEAVEQINGANPQLPKRQLFVAAYRVGNAHFGAIVNTLFLTYAGASLPLLLLFSVHQEPFVSFAEVINNELVATEIVRALVGSLGVAAAMPISTWLACRFLSVPAVRPQDKPE